MMYEVYMRNRLIETLNLDELHKKYVGGLIHHRFVPKINRMKSGDELIVSVNIRLVVK